MTVRRRIQADLCRWFLISLVFSPWLVNAAGDTHSAGKADSMSAAASPGFEEIYELLTTHCGTCHVQGGADGPWSLNTPPAADRFPSCLTGPESMALRCATYHQLTEVPGPDIPAWIRPEEAAASEPYVQACVAGTSFHIGHALPQGVPAPDCARLLLWIETGAHY